MKILKTLIHNLTDMQRTELEGNEIVELKVINQDLANFLANTPDDDEALNQNAEKLIALVDGFDAVLLPCGSPKFSWILSQLWLNRNVKAKALFAHSVRKSVEKEVEKFVPIEGEDGLFKKTRVIEKVGEFNHIRWF